MELHNNQKILYVGNHAGHFLTHRLPIFRALQQAEYEVHVAVPATADHLETLMTNNLAAITIIEDMGFIYHKISLDRSGMNPLADLRTLGSLYRLYREVQPDLAFHATIKPIVYGGIISRVARVPNVVNLVSGLGYVFLVQGIKGRLLSRTAQLAYKAAIGRSHTHTLFQNPDDYHVFLKNNIVSTATATIVKGSGVNMEEFTFVPEPDGIPVIMVTSRMLWDKGIGEFVEAARLLKQEGVSGKFVMVGDTDMNNPKGISRKQLQAWQDEGIVEWLGWRPDIPDLLQRSHLVCLPSYREGIPKSLIEAAACGRPIVTTDVPGCREVVHHGKNGLLVLPRNASALAEALRILIADPKLRQQMGKAGREMAEIDFSQEVIGQQVTAVCQSLLARCR